MCTARDFSLSRAVVGTASEDSEDSSEQLRVPSQCENATDLEYQRQVSGGWGGAEDEKPNQEDGLWQKK